MSAYLLLAAGSALLGSASLVSANEITSTLEMVSPTQTGGKSYTYMSVTDPLAVNLDGSIYGIAVCLSATSKANWTFSAGEGAF
jgi:hypothetical protein